MTRLLCLRNHELNLDCTYLSPEAQTYPGKNIDLFFMLEALFRHQTDHIDVFGYPSTENARIGKRTTPSCAHQ